MEVKPPTGREAWAQGLTVYAQSFLDWQMREGELRAALVDARSYVKHAPQNPRAKATLEKIDKALGVKPR